MKLHRHSAFSAWAVLAATLACEPAHCGAQQPGDTAPRGANRTLNQSWTGGEHLKPTGRVDSGEWSALRFIGVPVQDSIGEPVGTLRDLIIQPADGSIDFALISVAEHAALSPGAGSITNAEQTPRNPARLPGAASAPADSGRCVPVPWSLVQPIPGGTRAESAAGAPRSLAINVPRSEIEAAPAITPGQWADLDNPDWRRRVYFYYGIMEGAARGAAESPSGATNAAGGGGPSRAQEPKSVPGSNGSRP